MFVNNKKICYIHRMKKILFLLFLVALGFFVFRYIKIPTDYQKAINPIYKISRKEKVDKNDVARVSSVFVPEWELSDETILHNGYDRWIYFGGAEKLPLFTSVLPDKKLWLTVKVASVEELMQVDLDKYELSEIEGLVLDLEINGLATPKFVGDINEGVKRVYDQSKQRNMRMAIALYGDLFYRKRPYDLKKLNEVSDEIMIMAYDFHKSYGEPGANFPLSEFKKMIGEYLQFVPPEKLTVIFGMYGYDWTMKDGKPLRPAEAITLNQIKSRFLGRTCLEEDCQLKTDGESMEKTVGYKGEDGYGHIVHFEDVESVKVKTEFLLEQGIGSISYWAWGYF